jgi:hypothetical protein
MSWMMNDVLCKGCGYEEHEAMYKRADGPDDCPECGTTLSVDLRGLRFAIHGQGYGSFAPVDFGVLGRAETKEDYDRCVQTIEKRFPGKKVQIEHESGAQKQTRLDALRHRSWQKKKARSLDDKMVKEISAHGKRLKAEGRKETKSASQLAQGE